MAVRFDAITDPLSSTSSPPGDIFTVTWWGYLSADRNTFSTMWDASKSTSEYFQACTASDGITASVFISGYQLAGGAMTVGAWHRFALTRSGSTLTLRQGGETGSLTTYNKTSVPFATPTKLYIGGSVFSGEWFNGRIAAFKHWSSVLTVAEIDAELAQYAPVRVADLVRYHPFTTSPGLADESGNGRTLTAGSTATTTEAGPAIADGGGPEPGPEPGRAMLATC